MFFNYWLLKGGMLGLIWYLSIYFFLFRFSYKLIKSNKSEYKLIGMYGVLFSVIGIFQAYWIPPIIFFTGILLIMAYYVCRSKSYESSVC
jgi:hypothetical protein